MPEGPVPSAHPRCASQGSTMSRCPKYASSCRCCIGSCGGINSVSRPPALATAPRSAGHALTMAAAEACTRKGLDGGVHHWRRPAAVARSGSPAQGNTGFKRDTRWDRRYAAKRGHSLARQGGKGARSCLAAFNNVRMSNGPSGRPSTAVNSQRWTVNGAPN
eukprot:365291-Chlamydomonas_euryale.AAC.22